MNTNATGSPPTDQVTEIKFTLRDTSYPLVGLSAELECHVNLLEIIQPPVDEPTSEFLRVHDDGSELLVDVAQSCERTQDVQILQRNDGAHLVEVVISDSIVKSVVAARTILSTAHADDGEGRFTVFLPPAREPQAVVDSITDEHPSAAVASLHERPIAESFLTQHSLQRLLRDRLTDRQWEVLRLAYTGGYFQRPRETSQCALADTMGISQETVSQHLSAAQSRLLSVIFQDGVFEGPHSRVK